MLITECDDDDRSGAPPICRCMCCLRHDYDDVDDVLSMQGSRAT